MVGDTEADITAAKKHDIKIIAVESGIRDRTQLTSYQPDLIVPDLKTAVDFILNQ
jgi:phosphoglycolate phosphatase-like HAD superfamily hydrolase